MKNETCSGIQELLGAFHDRELGPEDRARVEEHLDRCAGCRGDLESLRRLDQLVRDKDQPPRLTEDYWDWHRHQVWKRIRLVRREREQPAWRQKFIWFRLGVVAAGVAAVLIVVVGAWRLLVLAPQLARPGTQVSETRKRSQAEEPAAGFVGGEVASRDEEPARDVTGRGAAMEKGMAAGVRQPARAGAEVEAQADREAEVTTAARTGAVSAQEPAIAMVPSLADAGTLAVLDKCEQMPEVLAMAELPSVATEDTATVIVRALVESDGSVSLVRIERSSGVKLLDTIAVVNVQRARFRPGMQADSNVRCWISVPQSFRAPKPPAEDTDSERKSDK